MPESNLIDRATPNSEDSAAWTKRFPGWSRDASIVSALVIASARPSPPPIPSWIPNRLAHLALTRIDLNHDPLTNYFEDLAHEDTAKSGAILVEANQVVDALGLDDEVVDGLLNGLGVG
jgi:hypothetical protein